MKVTADDVAQLLAGSPPRKVPAHVVKAAQGGGGGWFLLLFGLAFGSFGMIFAVIFFPWRLADDWRVASASARTIQGVITEVQKSSLTINDTPVMEYGFRYTPAEGGPPREGRCYTTGERWTKDAEVTVRYVPSHPDLACVEGARLAQGGAFGLLVLIFPLVGYGLVAFFVQGRRQTGRLLREGRTAEVDILAIEETNMTVNERRVYQITVASPAGPGGPPVTINRVNQLDLELVRRHAANMQPVFVLYDPQRPKQLIFPEALLEP